MQTGSRNEVEPGKSGFAHFFEHMMFRGTPEYPPEKYQAILTRSGARQNAFTSDDYIEAFPRGMFQFFPDPNLARRAQLFEVWIRPVAPENAHMALRIAVHELDKLIKDGLSQDDFEATRNYLLKNVYLLTATQDNQLGHRLDSDWYGIPEYTAYMRDRLSKLTREQVNAAIKKHLSADNLSIVIITKDAQGLKEKLVADAFSPIKYDAEKPAALLEEDKVIGALKLDIRPEAVRITPVDGVFAR